MYRPFKVWICTILYFGYFFQVVSGQWTSAGEKAVRGLIFSSTYDRLVRPTNQVDIKAALNILTIDNLDIKSQTLTMTGWLIVDWTDSRLTWTVDSTYTAGHCYALDSEIWKPELFIDNSRADLQILNDPYLQFKIENNGRVEWELPLIFQTQCEVDVTYYPFDEQKCVVELTSWAYTKDELALTALYSYVETKDMERNPEWSLVGTGVKSKEISETKASGAVATYPVLDFEITIRRNPKYYVTGVILPVILVAFLQTLVFVLPVDSGEKIGFSITVLLALAVLLTLVTDRMPSSAVHVSFLSIYLAMTLVLGVFCVTGTVVVIRIHHRDENILIPRWVRKMTSCCCIPISCWNGCCKKKATSKIKPKPQKEDTISIDSEESYLTWKDVAAIMDWFFFVFLLTVTVAITVAFVMLLLIGAYAF